MGLSFCEDDISVQPKKGHYRVDIAPELFLKRNGRGCDDNRLIHAFAVQQHRHKIAKGPVSYTHLFEELYIMPDGMVDD